MTSRFMAVVLLALVASCAAGEDPPPTPPSGDVLTLAACEGGPNGFAFARASKDCPPYWGPAVGEPPAATQLQTIYKSTIPDTNWIGKAFNSWIKPEQVRLEGLTARVAIWEADLKPKVLEVTAPLLQDERAALQKQIAALEARVTALESAMRQPDPTLPVATPRPK
jgi:hypothetical protein